jgi:hypothetical protein
MRRWHDGAPTTSHGGGACACDFERTADSSASNDLRSAHDALRVLEQLFLVIAGSVRAEGGDQREGSMARGDSASACCSVGRRRTLTWRRRS